MKPSIMVRIDLKQRRKENYNNKNYDKTQSRKCLLFLDKKFQSKLCQLRRLNVIF